MSGLLPWLRPVFEFGWCLQRSMELMIAPSWRRMYGPLAIASAAVCLVFLEVLGTWHVVAVAVAGVAAPLGLAIFGGRLAHETDAAVDSGAAPRALPWFGGAIGALAAVKFSLLGWLASGFRPSLHDEWSYLFGAQTLALGRLSNAPPPLAEFFDAFHILCEPRWMTRYPPGHPAALAVGVLVGWPPLVVLALSTGTVVWIYLLGRESGGELVGRFAGGLAVLAPGLDYLASGYLSQTTFLFAITGCFFCALRGMARWSAGWCAAAGSLGGWAILTRPYSAAALGVPLVAWMVWAVWRATRADGLAKPADRAAGASANRADRGRVARSFAAAVLPVLVAIFLFAGYNRATTGTAWRTAWAEYNEQFEVDNGLGFGPPKQNAAAPQLGSRKAARAATITAEKQRFTRQEALRRAAAHPQRAANMIVPSLGFFGLAAFAVFAALPASPSRVRAGPAAGLMLAAVAAHYFAYTFFYSTWTVYGCETLPFVIVLAAGGLANFWRRGRDSDRPMLAMAVPVALVVTIGMDASVQIPGFIAQRRQDTAYHRRFDETLERLSGTRAIVFVRLDSTKWHDYDLINNSPDLAAELLVVNDLGVRNAELLALERFADRKAYLFDEATWTLNPWTPPQDVPARWPVPRPDARVASLR